MVFGGDAFLLVEDDGRALIRKYLCIDRNAAYTYTQFIPSADTWYGIFEYLSTLDSPS